MSEEVDGASGGWRGPILMMIAAVLILLVVGFIVQRSAADAETRRAATEEAGIDTEAAVLAGRGARVRGRILLEVSPDPERPDAVAKDGTDGVETDGDTDARFEPEPPPEPEVELVPPAAGDCRITAWQEGEQVGEPVSCDDAGNFEVALRPNVHGRTAFELLVPGRLRAVVQTDVPAEGVGRLPPVALGLGQTVEGQVVDARGQPIADVELQAMPIPNLDEPEPWRTRSDAEGRFSFDTLPPGPVAIRAAGPGRAPSVIEAIAPQDDVLVVLEGLIDLQGEVVGPPEIVARARVRLEGSGIWPARTVGVDPRGGFVFTGIPDGVYAVEAVVYGDPAAKGKSVREYASVPLENVSPDLHVSLALTRAHRISTRVVDPAGNPVQGARVTVGNSQVGLLQRVARTDSEGRARLGPLVPGPYVVRADADAWLPSDPIALSLSDEDGQEQVLTLARPGRIEGLVVDEDGRPVANASVLVGSEALYTLGEGQARAQVFEQALMAAGTLGVTKGPVPEIPIFDDEPPPSSSRSPTTRDDGWFAIGDLAPGVYRLGAVHGRYARSGELEVRVRPGDVRTGVRLVLRTGHSLTGRVLDGNRRPLEGARIELDDGSAFETDDRGTFDAGYRRGSRSLVVTAPGKIGRRLEVRIGDTAEDIEVVLADAEGVLEGRATDGNGRPIANARVTLQVLDELTPTIVAFSDARGIFELDGLPVGRARLEIDHPDYVPAQRQVQVGTPPLDAPIELSLQTGWTLEIVAVERGTGDPIAGVSVVANGEHARTDAEGHAVLARLSGDRVRFDIEAAGRSPRSFFAERPSGDVAQVEIELVEGGGMEGAVIDYRGDPVSGSRVVVRGADTGEVLAETTTSIGGRWSVAGLPEGDVEVQAFPPPSRQDDLAEVAQASDVLRGHVTREVDLRFDRR